MLLHNERLQSEKGVTMVALIVTIIVLMILAAVTIYIETKQQAIPAVINATSDYTKAQINELEHYDKITDKVDSIIVQLEGN